MKYLAIIIPIFALLIVGCTPDSDLVACTMDAMQCPDGSYVGRIAPDCRFAECPELKEDSCIQDSDCSCGTNKDTGECAYGNNNFINIETQCPDFCTGIAGHLEIKCVENQCIQILKDKVTNFKECIAAGNPAMESYPRQCRHEDTTYVEVIEYFWSSDGIELMQHETEGYYGCFGCSTPESGPAMCIDPIREMKIVEETLGRYCNSDFEVTS